MNNNGYAVHTQDLCKSFGSAQVVRGVSLDARAGEIFSLLGPNGAGKTTTISMLTGLLLPSEGDAWIMGHSIKTEPMAVKRAIGVVPQDIALYTDLSARENLAFWGKMYGLRGAALRQRVDEVLDIIGLADYLVLCYSDAHKARTIIAQAKNKPLAFKPGKGLSYSDVGYQLLASIIERASGQPYGASLQANMFGPLGMQDSACVL